MKLDLAVIEQIEMEINLKHINKVKHPTDDIYILNYTHRCQFDNAWNSATILCRGLIVDSEYNRISNPFPKFFNFDQHKKEEIPNLKFVAHEKLDGSFISLFYHYGQFDLASRGSFSSDQAKWAYDIYEAKYKDARLDRNLTYIFELLHPKNRIVVDYGDVEDLALLAVRDIETGYDYDIEDFDLPFRKAKSYKFDDIETIKNLNLDNEEGFVIRFENGFRVKVKFDEYVRLHRILTNVSSKNIHEALMKGDSLDEILERVPDEFYNWVQKTKLNLEASYKKIENESLTTYYLAKSMMENYGFSRKKIAEDTIRNHPTLASIIFKMLDKKDYSLLIWKMIKPEYERPFKEDVDA